MSAYSSPLQAPSGGHDTPPYGAQLSEGAYVQLVRSVFTTLLPTTIMACSFTVIGLFVLSGTPDVLFAIFFALGIILALARIVVLLVFHGVAADELLSAKMAGVLERRFAVAYVGFASAFGLFTARAFAVAPPIDQILIVGLVFGYGAGVASGISLRPWISIPSALIGIAPTIGVSLWCAGSQYMVLGLLTAAFLAGGIESMLKRYQATSRQLAMVRLVATLARRDSLTGLANQLLLEERFTELRSTSATSSLIALYRLDLDKLQVITETYGRTAGDVLLKAVAERLNRMLNSGDFAVRLGGNEFAVMQTGLPQSHQADLFARRMAACLAKPYQIDGMAVSAPVHVGYSCEPQDGAELDHILGCASQALRRAKHNQSAVGCYNHFKWNTVSGSSSASKHMFGL